MNKHIVRKTQAAMWDLKVRVVILTENDKI